jgi:hypothetical protein
VSWFAPVHTSIKRFAELWLPVAAVVINQVIFGSFDFYGAATISIAPVCLCLHVLHLHFSPLSH